jgi:RNA recognition motif-containing protein
LRGYVQNLTNCPLLLCIDDFRIFVGDLGNEVADEHLIQAFSKYPSMQKARVVRDKRTGKTKGYGFVSFADPNDFSRALREMNGKYKWNGVCCGAV